MAGRKKPIASGEPRKRTEAVLLDERERLRIIFDTVGDPIFVKDNASRMILVNQSFYAVFGLDEQAVIGHTLAENVPPEERQFLEVDRRVLDTGQPDEREEALTVNGKATKYIVTRKRRFVDQSGNRFLVGSMHDITARKQAESAVVVTRNALQNVFDLVPDMICIASPNGFFLDVNPAFSSVLGYTREHLLATPYLDMMHPDDRAPTQQEIQRQLTGKATANFVNRYRCKDGTYKTLEWFATPNVGGVLYAAARDITDRRNAEESRLQFAQKVMNVREEEKKALAGILHHDIGSLTVGVMSRLDALEEDIREGKTRAALQWLKQAKRLFTESMAHFKQIAVDVRPPELDLIGLRAALRQYFAKIAQATGIRIDFSHNLGKRCLQGPSATILFRVAQEAVTNAVKHSQAKTVKVSLTVGKDELRFVIRDYGKGFNAELSKKANGAGMGIISLREMVSAASGLFTIDSKPGKGARILVRLPIGNDMVVFPETANAKQVVRSGRGARLPLQ